MSLCSDPWYYGKINNLQNFWFEGIYDKDPLLYINIFRTYLAMFTRLIQCYLKCNLHNAQPLTLLDYVIKIYCIYIHQGWNYIKAILKQQKSNFEEAKIWFCSSTQSSDKIAFFCDLLTKFALFNKVYIIFFHCILFVFSTILAHYFDKIHILLLLLFFNLSM